MEAKNLFAEYQNKKTVVHELAKKAVEQSWIDTNEYDSIISKLDKDVLTVGVIGQIKTGKSTFLNALAFGDNILPVASSTMTASLTVITYGEKKDVVAEFYSKEEWNEIKMDASSKLVDDADSFSKNRIEAAKELVDNARVLGSEINQLLGTKRRDSFENLIKYVGAGGQYVPITKSVTVHYPAEWLKGVEIVDTPGFNDPIVSREARTQEFLASADAVIMLLYSGRAFDDVDKNIVFEKVRNVGVGKILIGLNQFDLNYANGEMPEEMISYVKDQLSSACAAYPDSYVSDLLESVTPLSFSARMALMARMPSESLSKDPDLKVHYQQDCQLFSVSSRDQLFEKSRFELFETEVKNLLENSKYEILINKPINRILQAGVSRMESIDRSLSSTEIALKAAMEPTDDIEETLKKIRKAQKKVNMKKEFFMEDLVNDLGDILNESKRELEDIVDSAEQRCKKQVDNTSFFKNVDTSKIGYIINTLLRRDVPRFEDKKKSELVKKAQSITTAFTNEVSGVLDSTLDNRDELQESFRLRVKKSLTAAKNMAFDTDAHQQPYHPDEHIWRKKTGRKEVELFFDSFDYSYVSENLMNVKESIVKKIEDNVSTSYMDDIINRINEVECSKEEREKLITQYNCDIEFLKAEKNAIEEQLAEMKMRVGR